MHKKAYVIALVIALSGILYSGCKKPQEPDVPERQIGDRQAPGPGDRSSASPNPAAGDPFGQPQSLSEAFGALQQQRQSVDLTADQLERLNRLQNDIAGGLPSADKIAMLGAAADIHSAELLEIIQKALEDEDPQVRLAALALLGNTQDGDIMPLVTKAMSDKDEHVRQAALSQVAQMEDDERVGEVLEKGIADDSFFVRKTAVEMIAQQPAESRYKLYDKAIMNEHKDVHFETVTGLQKESSHATMDVLIKGLQHPDEQFRQDVQGSIDFLIQKRFDSYEEAKAWWDANKNNYNSQLFDKSLGFPEAP